MRGDNCGKYTDIGEKYFEEFNTLFWLRPGNKICLISLFTFIYIHNYIIFIYCYTTNLHGPHPFRLLFNYTFPFTWYI